MQDEFFGAACDENLKYLATKRAVWCCVVMPAAMSKKRFLRTFTILQGLKIL
jgi:hypothetical protein